MQWVGENLSFDVDRTVSLFETNIRIMGGLLSAHLLASDNKTVHAQFPSHTTPSITAFRGIYTTSTNVSVLMTSIMQGMMVPGYDGELLDRALDLGQRLLRAFDTPTGIPYGSINLRRGVLPGESNITATAAAATLAIEFGTLSRLTGLLTTKLLP